jgi:hypothetical protein
MSDYYLVGLVLTDLELEENVVKTWLSSNVSKITSIDCNELINPRMGFNRDDVPIFPSLRMLMESERGERRFMFTVIQGNEAAQKLVEYTVQNLLKDDETPGDNLIFTLPMGYVSRF